MNARALAAAVSRELVAAGVGDAQFEAELLVREAGDLSRAAFFAGADIDTAARGRLDSLVQRRQRREPTAYLRGWREFYGLDIAVGRGVLIPCPESELLADIALDFCSSQPRARIVDVGTGSGCIAAAIARHAGGARVIATDTSAVAIATAARNFGRLGVRAGVVRCRLASAIGAADLVVANLPYIPTDTIGALEPEVRDWEPHEALDGGPDGLALVRELIDDCAYRLHPKTLALEVMAGQAPEVVAHAAQRGATCRVRLDLAGIERVVVASWE